MGSRFDEHCSELQSPKIGSWKKRYGERHRYIRLTSFPAGMLPPKRVRVLQRNGRFVLQWWEPRLKKNVAEPVPGDLLNALTRAREIERLLDDSGHSGAGTKGPTQQQLLQKYIDDLKQRAAADEIGLKTYVRYASALRHYAAFVDQPEIKKFYVQVSKCDRAFALKFSAYLKACEVSPNGHAGSAKRHMRSARYVVEVVRGMFAWAMAPDRGALLPSGFRNPLNRIFGPRCHENACLTQEPDITTAMAADFLGTADDFALPLFTVILFFGLRAAEPCYLFREHATADWINVPNIPELAYRTKGGRDKRFPLVPPISSLIEALLNKRNHGLLFVRRAIYEGREAAPLGNTPLCELVKVFQSRCASKRACDALTKSKLRDQVLKDAGGLTYDDVEHEFQRMARKLKWPKTATLKDFRHLFATSMANAGMPEHYRRFLMGHAPGREAIVRYTHLNQLREHYQTAVAREWGGLIESLEARIASRPRPQKPNANPTPVQSGKAT